MRKKGKWTNTGEGMNPTGQAGEATDAAKLTKRRWGCGREVGWGPSSAQLTRNEDAQSWPSVEPGAQQMATIIQTGHRADTE